MTATRSSTDDALPKYIVGTQREALQRYISYLDTNYRANYDAEVERFERCWKYGTVWVIVLGALPAALVAVGVQAPCMKPAIDIASVLAPLIASTIAAVLGAFGIHKKYVMREQGRLFFRDLMTQAQIQYPKCKSEEDCEALHEFLRKSAHDEQQRQAAAYFAAEIQGRDASSGAHSKPGDAEAGAPSGHPSAPPG